MSGIDRLLEEFDRGSSAYLKVQPGKNVTVRIMPGYSKKDKIRASKLGGVLSAKSGILVFHDHEFLPKLGEDREDIRTNYRCLRDLSKPCGFCDFFDTLGESDKSIKARHGRRARAIIDFWLPKTDEVKRWFFGVTVLRRFEEIFDLYPDINSEKKGRDLVIIRTGQKLDTKYRIKVTSNIRAIDIESDLPDITDQLGLIQVATSKETRIILREAFEKD